MVSRLATSAPRISANLVRNSFIAVYAKKCYAMTAIENEDTSLAGARSVARNIAATVARRHGAKYVKLESATIVLRSGLAVDATMHVVSFVGK
jgi:hypothetical protein